MRSASRRSFRRMNLRSIVAVSVVGLAVVACGAQESSSEADGTWVGTITSEGNVTTVVNESGSVWAGTAKLVEEASIGVESGADEYMFSYVMGLFGTDEHIYIADEQSSLVRRYDHAGVYVDTIGGVGQGPGEYVAPTFIVVAPDGRVLVFDRRALRTQVYAPDGTSVGYWQTQTRGCCEWPMLLDEDDGALWMATRTRSPEGGPTFYGIQAFGPDGSTSDNYPVKVIAEPEVRLALVDERTMTSPFTPRFMWTPAGAELILAGSSDRYRFENQRRGETVLEVERYWVPVPIKPEHAEWSRKATVASGRRRVPGWTWDGSEMPEHHPAFRSLIATASGEVWVARFGPSSRLTDCVEDPLAETASGEQLNALQNPCWKDTFILDAFDRQGRYLGEIATPTNMQPFTGWTHVVGDRVIGVEMDAAGTIMVKRYRLVLPGERSQHPNP